MFVEIDKHRLIALLNMRQSSASNQKNSNVVNDTMNVHVIASITESFTETPVSSPREDALTFIGSRTDLVLSPDAKSVQLAPEPPRKCSAKKALLADSTTTSPIFRNDVRQEWINAIFGQDFFPSRPGANAMEYTPPKEGMGLAQIPSYLSYSADIKVPTQAEEETAPAQKVGVTLSRIPIGVYVRMVDIESEAFAAGIVPGSILIDINGMGVLGEPSHKLLERLWVYEGHFAGLGTDELKSANSNVEEKEAGYNNIMKKGMNGPIALTFIKDGHVYTAVFLTATPFGISWAPCANFALVQRSYAFAQKAGVRRGCIVAAVNHKSLREMDHLDTAMELKEQFGKGNDIRIVCIYTPAASRTNHHASQGGKNISPSKNNDFKSIDGIRIRKVNALKKRREAEKPTEYGVGSFFSCGTGANYTPVSSGSDHDFISDLANRVAAGEVAAPTGMKRGAGYATFARMISDKVLAMEATQGSAQVGANSLARSLHECHKRYNDCPTLGWSEIIPRWNFLDALVFCFRMHAASYNEQKFSAMGGIVGGSGGKSVLLATRDALAPDDHRDSSGHVALHSVCANLNLLQAVKEAENAHDIIRSYLPQIVALISSEQLYASIESKIRHSGDMGNVEALVQKEVKRICDEIIELMVDVVSIVLFLYANKEAAYLTQRSSPLYSRH